MYLEYKLQEDRYGWYIFNLKWQKMVERRYLETSKQQTRHRWCLQILNSLLKGNNGVFGLCQEESKVQCMYSPFTNLKIRSKKAQVLSES